MVYEIPKLIRDDADRAHTFILGKRMEIVCRNDFWGGEYVTDYFGENGKHPVQFFLDHEDNIIWEFETEDIRNLFIFLGVKVKANFAEGECDECGDYEVTDFYLPCGKNLYYESHFGNTNMPQGWEEFFSIVEEEWCYKKVDN